MGMFWILMKLFFLMNLLEIIGCLLLLPFWISLLLRMWEWWRLGLVIVLYLCFFLILTAYTLDPFVIILFAACYKVVVCLHIGICAKLPVIILIVLFVPFSHTHFDALLVVRWTLLGFVKDMGGFFPWMNFAVACSLDDLLLLAAALMLFVPVLSDHTHSTGSHFPFVQRIFALVPKCPSPFSASTNTPW